MNNKLLISLCMMMFCLSFAVATDYTTHPQNEDLTLSIQSNNATSCNLSSISYLNGTRTEYNIPLIQNGKEFYLTIIGSNYTQTGNTCHVITCSDGISYENGTVCRTVTSSDLTFFIILLVMAGVFFIGTWFVDEELFVYISGVLFIISGIYSMVYGISIVNNDYSRMIAFTLIGIGLLFTVGAYIYNGYSRNKYNEEEY